MHRKFQAKQTVFFAMPVSSQQNDKHPNEDQQHSPQTLVFVT